MPRIFKSLFGYTSVDEVYGQIEFFNITLHKQFPDDTFFIRNDVTKAVLDPVKGTIRLEKVDASSKTVSLKEWIEGDGLCRTDTQSVRFSSAPPMQNAYMSTH